MAISTPHQYPVHLSREQRERLSEISRNGHAPVKKVRHAQVLLLSDHGRDGGSLSRTEIAATLGLHVNSVDRIRKRFALEGEQPALERKVREAPPVPAKIDGRVEAHLVAICCGPAPEGRVRWTLRLLAAELTRRHLVTQVSAETVRRTLKKTNSSLGDNRAGASRNATRPASWPRCPLRGPDARFVAQMPASWPRWKTCSISTSPSIPRKSR